MQPRINPNLEPIFVVGFPRSGTTLLAAMLAAHSCLSCGPETRFFRFLERVKISDLLLDWPGKGIDFLFSILLQDIPVPDHFDLNKEQIYAYLSKKTPSISALLSSLTEQYMDREGKQRWVEKSPEHLMYVSKIRRYFPDAPIIRILRDPRDAALSMIKTPWATDDYLEAIMLWRKYDDMSSLFFKTDKNSKSIYYEKLVETPITVLKDVCSFLDEEFEEQMLNTSSSATNVVTTYEPWKNSVHNPVDRSRLCVWKRELPSDQNRIAEALIGDRLKSYDYELTEKFGTSAKVYPSIYKLLDYRTPLNDFVNNGVRFWRNGQEGREKITIYLGEPDRDGWMSYKKPKRWYDAFSIIMDIINRKILRNQIYWFRQGNHPVNTGIIPWILSWILRYTSTRGNL